MPDELQQLALRIREAMPADRRRFEQRLRAIHGRARSGRGVGEKLEELAADVERSAARLAQRRETIPRPVFTQDLPILARREEIRELIRAHPVCVICGETGSGKTTQLPKICLELGLGARGVIGHTQPRRIAARTVAARIAEELGVELGGAVGYKVRFGDRSGTGAFVKVMTDGILLAETQGDPLLEQYEALIVDEAHERSLNIDFLLGYLRRLQVHRPDLKIIITSATIDPERFARHFAAGGTPAPIVEVSGRTYPVEIRYRPIEGDEEVRDREMEAAILGAVDELASLPGGWGDVLVFLSGEREIRRAAEALRKHHPPGTEILPLYARLSAQEQLRAFQSHRGRRIVLATNVAETSLTVPGIKYVVDTGLARISRYSHRSKVQRLPVEPISQASAQQRAGRCGRVSDGVCVRLYSEEDFRQRPAFTDPEIQRTNLASVILRMKALRLGAVEDFPFVEPPDARMIRDGYETLHELGAIDERGELTAVGARLARLPIDPRIGRMILAAEGEGCLREVLLIAAALSVQDPRERPLHAQDRADEAHARFRDESSDFLSLLRLWSFYREQSEHLSWSKLRALCRDSYISFVRMREWEDVHRQLRGLAAEIGLRENALAAGSDAVHRALLAGLLSNVGMRNETFEYTGARGMKFHLFPGSALFKKGPKWVMAAELVQTTRLYARMAAKIQPEWIEPLAPHLVKRTYSDPHWSREEGQVTAFERVTLYGLEIAARRRVHYGPVDPVKSRELFLHHALVLGEWRVEAPFVEHNRRLREEVRRLEAKSRTHDVMADEGAMRAFFEARVPRDVVNVATFERWRRAAEEREPRLLFMAREHLMKRSAEEITAERYPDRLEVFGSRLELRYELAPGEKHDGVTLATPIHALPVLDAERCEWLVPGMLREKVLALLRCLPKAVRRGLEPVEKLADECVLGLRFGEGSLLDALGARIDELRGVRIARDAWRPRAIPEHLRMNIALVDEKGRELAQSRDVAELKRRYEQRARGSFSTMARSEFDRDGLTDWSLGELPRTVELVRAGVRVEGHPAMVDQGSAVGLRLLESAGAARRATRAGLRRLFILQSRDELAYHLALSGVGDAMRLNFATLGNADELDRELCALVADRAFLHDDPEIRTKAAFDARLTQGWGRIGAVAREVTQLVGRVLALRHAVLARVAEEPPAPLTHAFADIRHQLAMLTPRGFLTATPYEQLAHFPRYLSAVQVRLRKLGQGGHARDLKNMQELYPIWRRYLERAGGAEERPSEAPLLAELRWMIEEFRVSLFAQELGTAAPVSAKRLEELWAKVGV